MFWTPLAIMAATKLAQGNPEPGRSNAFPIGDLGGLTSEYLAQKIGTPAKDSTQFQYGSQAIRDAVTTGTATTRQRFGDAANTGGYLDSGAVMSGMVDIDRAGTAAYADQITQLLLGLEDRRLDGVLPFLQGASQEHVARGQIKASSDQNFMSNLTSLLGGCWVAAASYDGWDDPRTHAARRWVHTKAPAWFRSAYMRFGERAATVVSKSEFLRARVRWFFDRVTQE